MAGGWRKLGARLRTSLQRLTFSETAPRPIDQVIFEMNSLSGRTVSRAAALSVSPVLNGRNKLCAIATLPIVQLSASNVVQRNTLFEQIDPDVANVVTLAQTIEDLVFDSIAWWEIIAWDKFDYPLHARRRDPNTVKLDPPNTFRSLAPLPSGEDPRGASVWIDGREVSARRVIRYDSPNPGLLTGGGAKAIRRWLLLDAAAGLYASDPRPLDYFSPADDADDIKDEEVTKILGKWRDARKKRSTGWVPSSMVYHTVDSPTPQQMQLVDLQRQATLDIANAMSLDPEELGVSTTSRTYQNAVDRRIDRVNDVLAPYMRAITDRLSMGDVTRRGHRVVFWLADYLKSNPGEALAIHKGYHELGVLTDEEIRQDIGRPPLPEQPKPPPLDPVAEAERIAREAAAAQANPEEPMNNSLTTRLRFNATAAGSVTAHGVQRLELDAIAVDFKVEKDSRTIWGLAIPYNQIVEKYGMRFRFMPGSMEWQTPVSRHKMLQDHELARAIGKALSLTQTRAGVEGKYKLGRSVAADEALMDAEDEVRDGLSAGVEFDLDKDCLWNSTDECWDVYRADMNETSLTALPAFGDARVTKVAATQQEGTNMDCTVCGGRHAPGQACAVRPQPTPPANQPTQLNQPQPNQPAPNVPALQLNEDQLRALVANPAALAALVGVPAPAQAQPAQAAFTLSTEQINALAAGGHLRTLLGGLLGVSTAPTAPDPEPRPVVNPTRPVAVAAVSEEAPYRFDWHGNLHRGKFDFSTDVIQGLVHGDHQGLKRAETFMAQYFERVEQARMGGVSAQFVSQADAAALNPSTQRPDLYVDQKEYEYPIWNAINKGTIADATPFVLPKFSSSSGLVGAHTESVEPTGGTFVATSQTITPSPVSGKVLIGREAWDQGGNPQLSTLIWNQMVRGWYEALEASAVTMLEALAPTTLTIATAAADSVLEASLTNQLAPLQFVRGGFRMRDFFIQVDLYKALVAAKDGNGRKLFPVLGATNATGTTSEFFSALMVAGLVGRPAWALAATSANSSNSFLFDRADVSGWATAPQRLTFENVSVAQIHLGIWGYKALANTDLTGVRKVAYDPA